MLSSSNQRAEVAGSSATLDGGHPRQYSLYESDIHFQTIFANETFVSPAGRASQRLLGRPASVNARNA
jgi:hypothetical protein